MVAVREWAALQVPDTHLLGLVLVDDAPRVARPLAAVMNRVCTPLLMAGTCRGTGDARGKACGAA
jgi:hypothetical protein